MSNRTVPATAEGMSMLTRRQALRTLVAGSAAGALAAGAVVAVTPAKAVADPCLAFVAGWDRVSKACNIVTDDDGDAFWKMHCVPFEHTATWGVIPAATTSEGAAAALRKALAFGDMEQQDANLVRAALAFLEGGVA